MKLLMLPLIKEKTIKIKELKAILNSTDKYDEYEAKYMYEGVYKELSDIIVVKQRCLLNWVAVTNLLEEQIYSEDVLCNYQLDK